MRSRSVLTPFALILAALPLFASSVGALDSCRPVFDALTKVVTTPSHSFTTSTPSTGNGSEAKEAETIFVNGQKYIRVRAKWMRIPVTAQDVLDEEKEREVHGKSTCRWVRGESVNGEGASLYSFHRQYAEVTEDGQMWVSRGTGLPLRIEEDVDDRGNKVKEHRSTRFEYANIRPPV